jgi:hypothetical protein
MKCGCKRRTRDMRRAIFAKLVTLFGAGDVHKRKPSDGPTTPDICASHFAFVCARAARTNARATLREAWKRYRFPDERAVAVCQDDGDPPYVAMTFEDFIGLLDEWNAYRKRTVA